MKLLIFAHFVYAGRVGGAEQMLYNLVSGFCGNKESVLLACHDPMRLDKSFRSRMEKEDRCQIVVSGCSGPRFISEQYACLDSRFSGDAILFPNYFIPPYIPKRCGRVVAVIHDLQYRYFPQYFSARKRAWLRFAHRLTLQRADRVVVISNSVRDDIIRFYGDSAAKNVSVVHNPISWDRFHDDSSEGATPPVLNGQPYILAVAAQYPHKNLETIIRAFAMLAKRKDDIHLVLAGQLSDKLVGSSSSHIDIKGLISSLVLSDRVHVTGHVDDKSLGHLYRGASLFLFPSVFEGFGMPPVEAMGLGLPTLTTRSSSIPEVTLEKAHYVLDAYDVDEWAAKMEAMLNNPDKYRVSDETSAQLRSQYAPAVISAKYAAILRGVD